jgi:hypothetical protein
MAPIRRISDCGGSPCFAARFSGELSAALYLGKKEGKDLVYMGKLGTGWSRTISSQIRKRHPGESEIQAYQADLEAESSLARIEFLRRNRVPGHHL